MNSDRNISKTITKGKQEQDSEKESKRRKRSEALSSTSEQENSMSEQATPNKSNRKQQKKKSKNNDDPINEIDMEPKVVDDELTEVIKQMKQMNSKLERVESAMKKMDSRLEGTIKKGDGTIRETIKDLLLEMKEELLKSMVNRIEVLEGKLFERDMENDKLRTRLETLEKSITDIKQESDLIVRKAIREEEMRKQGENDAEQYSRRNNIKIKGIPDPDPNEPATETATKVINFFKEKKIAEISMNDFDIVHRIPNRESKNRDIIFKFVSRFTKDKIIRNRKLLKNSNVYVNEDLTKINLQVLMCVKKKMMDEVKDAWTSNGIIKYRDQMGHVRSVKQDEYQEWLDLPWPNRRQ
ncbi:hypothetical protein DPMN_004456 [Dreissena polymorpha]|uniref:Uncharacterized protein n=1 Tax=Dreissena polymorpha TaxID=45954 RepID=A0A9D4MQU6_DREPO|nr:hypothetical protein DPMN_004456 [Dreissena polymorpha]